MDSFEAERLIRLERQVARLYQHLGLNPNEDGPLGAQPAWGGPINDAVPGAAPQTYAHSGVPLPPAFDEAIERGKLINAIKIYREVTGVGLKEAKDAVDEIARLRGAR
ncbi:MAG TPA: ribosomal protein L7/L12 [Actinocrinis sp.]|jgi:ribosomal protein L7/L12